MVYGADHVRKYHIIYYIYTHEHTFVDIFVQCILCHKRAIKINNLFDQ